MTAPGVLLAIAIVSEVIATTALRASDGFTRPLPVTIMLAGYVCSFYLLSVIVRKMSIGLAYAIWAGIGTALIALISVLVYDEQMAGIQVLGIGFVIVGVVMINAAGVSH
ncbi:MAG: multidrug efflux SMR transporter [Solirubrobacterales bacterium]